MQKIKTLIVGAHNGAIGALETTLREQAWFDVESEYSAPNQPTSWSKVEQHRPGLVLLSVESDWQSVLSRLPASLRNDCILVVYGPVNSQAMRLAMQVGARDYFSPDMEHADISDTLRLLAKQVLASMSGGGQAITVINAKGGSGGSFIARSLAQMLMSKHQQQTALLDFDFQYGVQSLALDLIVRNGVDELMRVLDELDHNAIRGYMLKHDSGIYLMAEKQDHIVLPGEFKTEKIARLVELSKRAFDKVVIDLPRIVDATFSSVVTSSNRILLVMQQSVAHVRDARRLYSILVEELEISRDQITIIINRYDSDNNVTKKAIMETVGCTELVLLANDYKRVTAATDLATPISEYAPTAPLTKELLTLAAQLAGETETANRSMFQKMMGGLFKR